MLLDILFQSLPLSRNDLTIQHWLTPVGGCLLKDSMPQANHDSIQHFSV